MKLILDTKSFVDAIAWVSKTLDTKNDKSYIALVVNANGNGYVSHTNGLSYIKCEVQVDSVELEPGRDGVSLALDGAYVKRFASTFRDFGDPLTFTKELDDPRASLSVTRPQENYTIPIVDSVIGAEPKYETIGSVSDAEFFDALTKLTKLTDPVNSGIVGAVGAVDLLVDADEETVTLMATDRYALGEIILPFTPESGAQFFENVENLLLPAERAGLIAPSKGQVDQVELLHEAKSSKFGYRFPDGRIVLFALSTSDPLPYGPLKDNAETDSSALVSVTELRNALSAISNLAYAEADIVLNMTKNGLIVSDVNELNTRRVTIQGSEGIGEGLRVEFTRSILNEALVPLSSNRVNIKWKSEFAPFIFTPVLDDDSEADNVFLLAIPKQDS